MQGNQYHPNQQQYQIMAYRQQPQQLAMPMPQVYMPPTMQPDAPEAGMLQIIWRRKWIVLLVMLVAIAGGFIYLHEAPKKYTASAMLELLQSNTAAGTTGAQEITDQFRNAQVSIISSVPVLQAAIDNGELEILGSLQPNPLVKLRQEALVDIVPKTGVITVAFPGSSPQESIKIVNAIVDSYKAHMDRRSVGTAESVVRAFQAEFAEQEKIVEKVRADLNTFLDVNPGATIDGDIAAADQWRMYSGEVSKQEIAVVEAAAAYQSSVSAFTKRAWENAQAKLGELIVLRDAAEKAYLDKVKGSRQYAELDARYKAAADKLQRIDMQIEQARTRMLNEKQVAVVNIIQNADPTEIGVSPQKSRVLAVAVAIGLFLGVGAGLLRDYFDQRLRSAEEVMATLGVPVVGTIPHMSRRISPVQRGQKVFLDPMSEVAEAFRTVRTAVYFGARSEKAKTLLITSSEPGDGKSTSASNLAIAMSQAGQRTLLLDCDFRKPTQHKIFEVSDSVGVSTVLAGREPLERAIQRTAVEGLDLLPGGPIPLNPSEILNSQAFADMLDELSVKYDHIVIDSPPVNAVTDARILAALCDVTLLILRAEKTTRRHAEYARDGLMSVGARLLGTVVNDVSRGQSGSGFYSGYGYYGQAANAVNVTGGPAATRVTPRRILPNEHDVDERIA